MIRKTLLPIGQWRGRVAKRGKRDLCYLDLLSFLIKKCSQDKRSRIRAEKIFPRFIEKRQLHLGKFLSFLKEMEEQGNMEDAQWTLKMLVKYRILGNPPSLQKDKAIFIVCKAENAVKQGIYPGYINFLDKYFGYCGNPNERRIGFTREEDAQALANAIIRNQNNGAPEIAIFRITKYNDEGARIAIKELESLLGSVWGIRKTKKEDSPENKLLRSMDYRTRLFSKEDVFHHKTEEIFT
jgi:hypothetical protein